MNDSLLHAFESAFWVTLFIGLFVWSLLGYFVGQTKGRPSQGAWLGVLLGVIGVFAVGMMDPTDEETRRRQRLVSDLDGSTPAGGLPNGNPSRAEMVAEALRQDPTLGDLSDPGAPARLQAALAATTAESQFRADIDAAHAYEATKAAALAEAERADADRQAQARQAHEQALMAAAEAEADKATRAAKLASMSAFPRWLATHQSLAAIAGVTVLALIITGLALATRSNVVAASNAPGSSSPASPAEFSGSYTVTTSVIQSNQADQSIGNAKSFTWVVTTDCSGSTCTTTAVGDGVTTPLTAAGSGFHSERKWLGDCPGNQSGAGQASWTTVTDLTVDRVDNGKVKSLSGTSRSSQLGPCSVQRGPLAVISYSVRVAST